MDLKIIFDFLADLKSNNNREWFQANKARYELAKNIYEQFIELLIPKIKEFDASISQISAKECIYRIYRDIRFSKNKQPYKTHFDAFIASGGRKSKKAGYYIHLEPGVSMIGGGIYRPEPAVLKALRSEIYYNADEFKEIVHHPEFQRYFKELYGEKLKLAPKGFPKDFPDIDLLKYKSYVVTYSMKDGFWLSKNTINEALKIFKTQSAFNRFLNRAVDDLQEE